MKGVIGTRAPGQPIVDLTHAVPPQDVRTGAIILRHAAPWFPKGTVHVAVVDPGVGSERTPLCIETDAALFVGPDNGLLTLAAPRAARRRTVALADLRFHLVPTSATFHGRDVFAPVAAALATGTSPTDLGPPADVAVELEWTEPVTTGRVVLGVVAYVDTFGNLVTNVPGDAVTGSATIEIGGTNLGALRRTYADVAAGEIVAVVGSWGLVEIAVRNGSAAATLGAAPGSPVRILAT
jgi:S-adenosyl-L-methionine hydrolase (adenosine-forming)